MTDFDDLVFQRSSELGQGYQMTQLVKITRPVNGTQQRDEHRLEVHARTGNHGEYATVKRWDGTQWHEVIHVYGKEMPEAPSYVCWKWEDRDGPNNRQACLNWLIKECDAALDMAKDVLL